MSEKQSAWLFCRVASSDNASAAMEHQEKELRRFCNAHNLTAAGVTRVYGSSRAAKTELQKIAYRAEKEKDIDVLLTKSVSRLSRSMADVTEIFTLLNACGVKIATTDASETALTFLGEIRLDGTQSEEPILSM